MYTRFLVTQGLITMSLWDLTCLHSSTLFTLLMDYFLYLSQRQWKNDPHMAIRDCHRALKLNPSSNRALICMAEALSMVTQMTLEFYNSTILCYTYPIF